jgi:hypothetical protein
MLWDTVEVEVKDRTRPSIVNRSSVIRAEERAFAIVGHSPVKVRPQGHGGGSPKRNQALLTAFSFHQHRSLRPIDRATPQTTDFPNAQTSVEEQEN